MPQSDTRDQDSAIVMAGIPNINGALYRAIRFSVGDPVAYVELPDETGGKKSLLILRDIEMGRARQHARADNVACPADFTPRGGLSGDRETATAQAAAECLRQAGVISVVGDRTLPLIFAEMIRRAGIGLECDTELGVAERRSKDEQEVAWIRQAQEVTEGAMEMACRLIASSQANGDGILIHDGSPLTSQRVRAAVDHWLLDQGYSNPPSIVAGGPDGGDCHNLGHGELKTGQPVIIDIFPRNRETLYNGDCTRTVVHGDVPDEIVKMHDAVRQAKAAAIAATKAGITGEQLHLAASEVITQRGYAMGLPEQDAPGSYCAMTHGTGHGVGLDVHEPPLLDLKGPELVVGDVITIEPGLYRVDLGGVRVEDMIVVTRDGHENLNCLPEGLDWR